MRKIKAVPLKALDMAEGIIQLPDLIVVSSSLWHSPDNFCCWFLRHLFFPDTRSSRGHRN